MRDAFEIHPFFLFFCGILSQKSCISIFFYYLEKSDVNESETFEIDSFSFLYHSQNTTENLNIKNYYFILYFILQLIIFLLFREEGR